MRECLVSYRCRCQQLVTISPHHQSVIASEWEKKWLLFAFRCALTFCRGKSFTIFAVTTELRAFFCWKSNISTSFYSVQKCVCMTIESCRFIIPFLWNSQLTLLQRLCLMMCNSLSSRALRCLWWKQSPLLTSYGCSVCVSPQFEAYVKEGSTGVVVNLSVDDRDDPATGAGRALYSIINGDPTQSFEIHTNPDNNEGMLAVVKVRWQAHRPMPHKHTLLC